MVARMVALVAGLLVLSPPALADPLDALALKSGNDLYSVCGYQNERSELATGMEMACIAYIASAADSYSVTFCSPPDSSTRGQARDVVVKYLKAHPKDRQNPAIHEAWLALSAAWPCKK